jgi:hypothetical protein
MHVHGWVIGWVDRFRGKCAWIIGGSLYTIHECVAPACSYIGPDATPAEMEGGVCVNERPTHHTCIQHLFAADCRFCRTLMSHPEIFGFQAVIKIKKNKQFSQYLLFFTENLV